jgi:hypothetical protein
MLMGTSCSCEAECGMLVNDGWSKGEVPIGAESLSESMPWMPRGTTDCCCEHVE